MRFIKFILVVLIFLFFMVFFVQNQAELATPVNLKFQLFNLDWHAQPLPFYLWVIVFMVLGALCSAIVLILDRIRVGARYRAANSRANRLQAELDALKAKATPSLPETTPST